jgi:hypothetical protein
MAVSKPRTEDWSQSFLHSLQKDPTKATPWFQPKHPSLLLIGQHSLFSFPIIQSQSLSLSLSLSLFLYLTDTPTHPLAPFSPSLSASSRLAFNLVQSIGPGDRAPEQIRLLEVRDGNRTWEKCLLVRCEILEMQHNSYYFGTITQ